MGITIDVVNENNINVEVTPQATTTITIDRGVAGVGIESIAVVYIDPNYYLDFTYTNGTNELVEFPPIAAGVTSFNTRIGVVTLTSLDVTDALGFTPPTPTGTGASGTWAISVSGNAATATNGIVSTDFYSDPSWITDLNASKIIGTLSVSNGGTGVNTSTGSGNVVLSTSPTLVTPVLGTPASGNLVNCTFPTLNQNTSGTAAGLSSTLVATSGGTGQSTVTTGDLLIGGTNSWSKLAIGSAGQILKVTSGAPAWSTDAVGTVTSVGGTGSVNGITLTGTVTTSGDLTLGGILSGIGNSQLTNSAITINGTSTSLGGSADVGTVTTASVASANGFAGTVATSSTTPNITLSTTVTGLLKGNGTAISAATSGTDYAPATSGTSILYGNGAGGFSNVTIGTGVAFAGGTLSATGTGGTVTSVTGTAPVASSGGTTPAISLNTGYGDTLNPYAAKTANYVLAGPTAGASAVPAFRAIVAADIPSLTGTYVPYTGATADVDLDTFVLNAKAFHAKGTGGNGHLGLKHQSSTPSSTANESSIFADTNGNLGWLNGNNYLSTFSTSGNTANKTYTFPNTTGTVALTSDLTSYLTSVSGTAGRVSSTGGTTPVIDLVSGIASAGTTGSASLIPVVTIDTYGRVTTITTAANPQGTVTSITAGTGLSGGVITSTGTIAIDSTVATLTGTQTLTNKTISGGSNTLSNIGNGSLTNSSVTINGSSVSLGGSVTVTATASNALTIGTGLSGTSYNGSTAITIAIDSTVATLTGTQTLTNKRIDPRVSSTTSTGTLTPDISSFDQYCLTAQAVALTVAAPTGTPVNGDKLIIRILDNATSQTISWNATYTVIGVTLPTATTISKMLYVGCIYNAANTRWDVVAVTTQA